MKKTLKEQNLRLSLLVIPILLIIIVSIYNFFPKTTGKTASFDPSQPDLDPLEAKAKSNIPNVDIYHYHLNPSEGVDTFSGELGSSFELISLDSITYLNLPIDIIYSSHIKEDQIASVVGLGWNLNLPYIIKERKNYKLVTGGIALDLVLADKQNNYYITNPYNYQRIKKLDNGWEIKDGNGITIKLEEESEKNQKVYKWDISSIEDTYGNKILFNYWNPTQFDFGKKGKLSYPYLRNIENAADGIELVKFHFTDRTDVLDNNGKPLRKLQEIEVRPRRVFPFDYKIRLNYEYDSNKLLLTGIDRIGRQNGIIPSIRYEYTNYDSIPLLSSIDLTTGGIIEYSYEENPKKKGFFRVIEMKSIDSVQDQTLVTQYDYGSKSNSKYYKSYDFIGHQKVTESLLSGSFSSSSEYGYNLGLKEDKGKEGLLETIKSIDYEGEEDTFTKTYTLKKPKFYGKKIKESSEILLKETTFLSTSPERTDKKQTFEEYDDYGNILRIFDRGYRNIEGDETLSEFTYELYEEGWYIHSPKTQEYKIVDSRGTERTAFKETYSYLESVLPGACDPCKIYAPGKISISTEELESIGQGLELTSRTFFYYNSDGVLYKMVEGEGDSKMTEGNAALEITYLEGDIVESQTLAGSELVFNTYEELPSYRTDTDSLKTQRIGTPPYDDEYEYAYDEFGRKTEVKHTYGVLGEVFDIPIIDYETKTSRTVYSDPGSIPNFISTTIYDNDNNPEITTVEYYSGFGDVIQTQVIDFNPEEYDDSRMIMANTLISPNTLGLRVGTDNENTASFISDVSHLELISEVEYTPSFNPSRIKLDNKEIKATYGKRQVTTQDPEGKFRRTTLGKFGLPVKIEKDSTDGVSFPTTYTYNYNEIGEFVGVSIG